MRKCFKCGVYSLSIKCPKCGASMSNANPPKFSIGDKKALYRRVELKRLI